MGRFLVGGWGQGADSPQKGAKLKIFFILLLSLRQLMAYNDIKNNIHGLRSYFRLLAACLPWLIYQLLVHKSQSSLFKAPPLDPASPAFFLKFLFHLPSPLLLFLFHPLLRYFRLFPLLHSMLVAYAILVLTPYGNRWTRLHGFQQHCMAG